MMIGRGDQAAHAEEARRGGADQADHGDDGEPEEDVGLAAQQIAVEIGAHVLQLLADLGIEAVGAELFDQAMEHIARLHVVRDVVKPVAVGEAQEDFQQAPGLDAKRRTVSWSSMSSRVTACTRRSDSISNAALCMWAISASRKN